MIDNQNAHFYEGHYIQLDFLAGYQFAFLIWCKTLSPFQQGIKLIGLVPYWTLCVWDGC